MNNQDNYLAWKIKASDFPKNGKIEEKIAFLIRYGILAPSTHNTQPWKFKISGNILEIYPDFTYKLPQGDPTNTNLYISLGCFVTNIFIAADYFGLQPLISTKDFEKDKKVVIIFLVSKLKSGKENLGDLLDFIPRRYSYKLRYQEKNIPQNVFSILSKITINGIEVKLMEDRRIIEEVSKLQQEAVRSLAPNIKFRQELSTWLRPNDTKLGDGIPGFVAGFTTRQSKIGKILIKMFPFMFKVTAKKDEELIKTSPAIGVIVGKSSTLETSINVGRVYELIALRLTLEGLSCTLMHAIVADKSTVKKLEHIFNIKGKKVFLFFRLGYPSGATYHTPRRNLEESMLNDVTEFNLANKVKGSLEIKQTQIGNHIINYVKTGTGSPVLLVHGGNIGWGQWYPNIAEFAKKFTVYAIDLMGGGRSSRIDYSKLDLEKDLVNVVESFINKLNLRNPDIVGSSIGGWIALKIALNNKARINKLVLADCIGFSSHMAMTERILGITPLAKLLTKTILRPSRRNKNIEKFLRDVFYNKSFPILREFIDYFYETMRTSHNLLFISRLSSIKGMRKEFLLMNDLSNVKNKTLIIWGEKDKLMPLSKVYDNFKLIPNSQIKVIKNAGHIPSIEKSEEFNNIVLHFLVN